MAGTVRKARKVEPVAEAPKSATPAMTITKESPTNGAGAKSRTRFTPDQSAIALRAWEIWQREGCPEGRALDHWLMAERELVTKSL